VGRPDEAGFGGGTAGWERELTGGGPCVNEGTERRRQGWKVRIKEENVFCGICQRRARAQRADEGNSGMWKRRASVVKEEEEGWWGRVGQKG
jgi:hypothetical protein